MGDKKQTRLHHTRTKYKRKRKCPPSYIKQRAGAFRMELEEYPIHKQQQYGSNDVSFLFGRKDA